MGRGAPRPVRKLEGRPIAGEVKTLRDPPQRGIPNPTLQGCARSSRLRGLVGAALPGGNRSQSPIATRRRRRPETGAFGRLAGRGEGGSPRLFALLGRHGAPANGPHVPLGPIGPSEEPASSTTVGVSETKPPPSPETSSGSLMFNSGVRVSG